MDYTVTVSDTEKKSLEYIAADVSEWLTSAAKNRARIAKEEIISLNTDHCNANSVSIAVGEDAQVTQAFTLGVVKTAADRNKESESKL